MTGQVRDEAVDAARESVPFLVIVVIWTVVSLALYGVFLVTKPGEVSYDAWVYVSVFAVPMVGFFGHVLRQALKAVGE